MGLFEPRGRLTEFPGIKRALSLKPHSEIIQRTAGLSFKEAGRFYWLSPEADSSLAIASVSIVEPSNCVSWTEIRIGVFSGAVVGHGSTK